MRRCLVCTQAYEAEIEMMKGEERSQSVNISSLMISFYTVIFRQQRRFIPTHRNFDLYLIHGMFVHYDFFSSLPLAVYSASLFGKLACIAFSSWRVMSLHLRFLAFASRLLFFQAL